MIKAKPLALAQKLKNIVDICEAADAEIESQKLIQKGALDAGKESDGIEPAVVRKILARRKKLAKDPAEAQRLEDLMTDYQFMLGEGREGARPWTQTDDEISRVMALTNTSKPPKIEAIKKALGCSQGKAHKLRSIVAVRLAKKSSSSSEENEHEHSDTPHDADGVVTETQESCGADIEQPATDDGRGAVNNQGGSHETDVRSHHHLSTRSPAIHTEGTNEENAAHIAAQSTGESHDTRRLTAGPEVARGAPPGSPGDDPGPPPAFLIRAKQERAA